MRRVLGAAVLAASLGLFVGCHEKAEAPASGFTPLQVEQAETAAYDNGLTEGRKAAEREMLQIPACAEDEVMAARPFPEGPLTCIPIDTIR
jgi:hypothetical protein